MLHYIIARYQEKQVDKTYRIYITDALRNIAQGDKYPSMRWIEIIEPKPVVVEDAKAITDAVVKNAGLVVIHEPIRPSGEGDL